MTCLQQSLLPPTAGCVIESWRGFSGGGAETGVQCTEDMGKEEERQIAMEEPSTQNYKQLRIRCGLEGPDGDSPVGLQ